MDRFVPALRRVAGELDLPRRARTAVLLEMAADLEAVYEHHRGRGLPEEEAMRRAEEAVLASSEVIRRLGRLHRSSWRGWAEEAGERLTGGFELLLLLAGVLPALVVSGLMAGWVLRAGGSPLAWLLAVTAVLMVVTAAGPGVRRRSGHGGIRRGASPLLVLCAMAPAIGLLAMALGVQAAAATISGVSPTPVSPGGTATAAATAVRLAGDAGGARGRIAPGAFGTADLVRPGRA